jgi:hypothetical protein
MVLEFRAEDLEAARPILGVPALASRRLYRRDSGGFVPLEL